MSQTPALKNSAISTSFTSQSISNSILLYDTTAAHFSYISSSALVELKHRRLVNTVDIPLLSRQVKIYNGWKGEELVESVVLPTKVVMGRLLGWWDRCFVVEGWEDV